MLKRLSKRTMILGAGVAAVAVLLALALMLPILGGGAVARERIFTDKTYTVQNGEYYGSLAEVSENYTNRYVLTRHKSLGASHYAYTEGVSDEFTDGDTGATGGDGGVGHESVFNPGSELVLLTTTPDENGGVNTQERVLLESREGVIRDPDVSPDGRYVAFSWKKSKLGDDFHLYIMDLEDGSVYQLTYGMGNADTEPKFLANGKLVFSSTRDMQRVDCWKTLVSNLYTCDIPDKLYDGCMATNIRRLGYDQVHTTYPTVTSDGRVLYTRWDYNDRNQMYVQAIFQMFEDGSNQTELYGNGIANPTTLLHSREIPGAGTKYISIASGHHTYQGGKLCIVDASKGSNAAEAIEYPLEKPTEGPNYGGPAGYDENGNPIVDLWGQDGAIYKYPYALNEYEFFVARAASWAGDKAQTRFDLYYINLKGYYETGRKADITAVKMLDGTEGSGIPVSQLVPVVRRELFERPSMVNYAKDTGTYYMADVYSGQGLEGVERGTAKYLRVVALDFRAYAVGTLPTRGSRPITGEFTAGSDPSTPVGAADTSWDVKRVIGIVPIEEDGSVMVEVPAETPVFFQVLDENGCMIQTMRSWSTLTPGENYSCVGCHENKTTAPMMNGGVTMAMRKGTQRLVKDFFMEGNEAYADYDPYTDSVGFSFLKEVQPILDNSCVSCHNNQSKAVEFTGAEIEGVDPVQLADLTPVDSCRTQSEWYYRLATADPAGWADAVDPAWTRGQGGFGYRNDGKEACHTEISNVYDRHNLYMVKEFTLTENELDHAFYFYWQYDESPVAYINGVQVGKANGFKTAYELSRRLSIPAGLLRAGKNVVAIKSVNTAGGRFMDAGLYHTEASDVVDPTINNPISFDNTPVLGQRERMFYSLGYLVLTQSYKDGDHYTARPEDDQDTDRELVFTNWIDTMSKSSVMDPYYHGSFDSPVVTMFLEGDYDRATDSYSVEMGAMGTATLKRSELAAIATWIDMMAPLRGTYDESNNWNANDTRWAEENTYQREYYDAADRVTKKALAGVRPTGKITLDYNDGLAATTEKGLVMLPVMNGYAEGDTITVTLPRGQNFVYLNIHARIPTTLLYTESGTITYRIPTNAFRVLPRQFSFHSSNVITAWLPTEAELAAVHNLALNPYARGIVPDGDGYVAYPTVVAGSTHRQNNTVGQFDAANAVDGYANNKGHGEYPLQSWGPESANAPEGAYDRVWLTVDFGREVNVSSVVIYQRADWKMYLPDSASDHDNYAKGCVVSVDGVDYPATMTKTAAGQTITLPAGVTGSSVTVKNFDFAPGGPEWFGIAELEVYGSEIL